MKKTLAVSALALAVLAGCQSNNTTTAIDSQTRAEQLTPANLVVSPNDKRAYETLTLENGIDVILVSDPKAEKSAAALSVGIGLLHDPMSQQGMAHYLEHMLFLGTERYPDTKGYSEFMTKNGGAHNAYTWLDITNYMFKINNDAYGEALDRFSDFFKSPKLYPEYTEKEKNAVNAEWSMRREMDFFGQFKLARKMMGEHPANRFLIGNLETLGDKEGSKLHQETVDFYNKYYSANIMKVALISNRPINEMRELATQYFADIENKQIDEPRVTDELNFAEVGKKRVHYKPNQDVKQLKIDFTLDNNMDEFALKPNRFITYLLSNEMPGSPAQILRDKGWVSGLSAQASPNMYGNYGQLSIDVNLTDAGMQNREAIVATVMQYIELIKEQGVDKKYFDEIRTSLNNQFQFLEKSDEFSYVSGLTQSMQDYPLTNAINAPYFYGEFDEQAINDVLAQLTPEHLRIWYVSQQEQTDSELHFYDGKYRIEDISDDEIASWSQPSELALALPSVNRLLPEQFDIKTQATQGQQKPELVYDENGIKVWNQPSLNFAHQPKGLVELYVNTPIAIDSAKARVLMNVWADLYNLGNAALATEASIAGMSVGMDPGQGFTLSVGGFTDKQAVLLTEALKGLKLDVNEQMFAQAIDRYVRGLKNAQKQFPYYQAFGEFGNYARRGSFDTETLIATAQSLNVTDLNTHIDTVLKNNNKRVLTFGNYDLLSVKAFVKDIKQTLGEQASQTPYTRAQAWKPQAGEVFSVQKDIDVADVAIIDMAYHPTPGYEQKAAATVLQGHFRTVAFDKLRTEEQLAYAVGALASPIEDYAGIGLFIQTPVKGPKAMQARFDEFKTQYAKELQNLDEATFAQLKNATLVSLKEQPKNLNDELERFMTDWYRENFEFDSRDKLIAAVEKLELKDIQDFYKQTVLNPDAARLNIQLRGNKFSDKPFATLDGQVKITTPEQFYEQTKTQ